MSFVTKSHFQVETRVDSPPSTALLTSTESPQSPTIKLTKKEHEQIKRVAKDLLDTLKAERLVLDWRKQQKTRAAVRVAIFDALEQLPEPYTNELYDQKCELVY